jgi:hypothetical protein
MPEGRWNPGRRHNDQVFGEILGLSSEKIAELKEKGAIMQSGKTLV